MHRNSIGAAAFAAVLLTGNGTIFLTPVGTINLTPPAE